MADSDKGGLLSVEGAIGLLVAVVAAAGDMNWYLRSGLVLFGLALIAHLAWRIPRKGLAAIAVKALTALVLSAVLIAITWQPIWDDFHRKNPTVTVAWAENWIKEKIYGPPPPPPPPKPWVTSEEIEVQKKFGRTLLIYSPDELIGMEALGEDIGLYLNKWIKIDYPIAAAPFPYSVKKQDYIVVEMIQLPARAIGVLPGVIAYFDPKKWGDRLLAYRKGSQLTAFCRLQSIEKGTPTGIYGIRRDAMVVDNCELP